MRYGRWGGICVLGISSVVFHISHIVFHFCVADCVLAIFIGAVVNSDAAVGIVAVAIILSLSLSSSGRDYLCYIS